MAIKYASILAMAAGLGFLLYSTGEGIFVEGVGAESGTIRKHSVLLAGAGAIGILLQMPLSERAVSIFNGNRARR